MGNVVALILVSVLVGAVAQLWKGRTGFVWALVALGLQSGVVLVTLNAVISTDPNTPLSEWHRQAATTLIAVAVGGGLALIVVATLPKLSRRAAPPESDRTVRKCPFCAELVRHEAIVCKHCQRDLPPPQANADTALFGPSGEPIVPMSMEEIADLRAKGPRSLGA